MARHFAIARRSLMRFRPDVKWMPPCYSAMSGVLVIRRSSITKYATMPGINYEEPF
jgi:hypothetical protein